MICRNLLSARRAAALWCAVVVLLGWCRFSSEATAAERALGGQQACCSQCGAHCRPAVECTMMVPMCVTEPRVKNCIVKKQVEREETYTVFRQVPETREYKKEICYLDDEVKSKEIIQEKCRIVNNPVVQTYRVKVPVCEEQTEMVQRERCINGELVCVEEPCTRQVIRLQEDVRTNTCEQPQLVIETNKCTIDYCVKTPKTHEIPCMEETVYKLVPEERKRTVVACVPTVERQVVEVQVTKMVPQTVICCQHCATKLRRQNQEHAAGHAKNTDGHFKGAMGKVTGALGGLKDKLHHK